MQHMVAHNMLLPLIASLLLIAGGGGWHASFVNGATTAPRKPETPMAKAYWETLLPGTSMPPAISALLAQRNVLESLDGVNISPNNIKFVKGMRKIGPNYDKVKSEPAHGDKHVRIASQAEVGVKEISMSYGSQAHRPEMKENLKEISVSYGLRGDERNTKKVLVNLKKILRAYRLQKQENIKEISYGSKGREDLKEISVSNGSEGEKDLNEISLSYGSEGEKDLKKILVSYGSEGEKELKEISMSYGVEGGDGVKEISVSYGTEQTKKPKEASSHGTKQKNMKEFFVSYGSDAGKDEQNEVLDKGEEGPNKDIISHGSEQEEDPYKATMSYGSEQEEDPHKATMSYGSEHEDDPHKATMSYGTEQEDDLNKTTMSYGSEQEDDPQKITMSYGSEQEDDLQKNTMSYGTEQEEDPHKVTMSYGSEQKEVLETISSQHEAHMNGHGSHHHQAHSHSNKRQQADVFFFHDMLRAGSIITPTILPTSSLPTLLPRSVAGSIPFSSERLSDIISMFAPASLSMTREIRWTLDTCEHPRTLPGQSAGCATSLESLAELPASLLRTRNVRAFSAADLPVEAPGTRALRGRYNVTAVRKVSGESSEIVTCHDLTYPYAVYYCHTANPTSAYTVTLASVEDGAVPKTMEALAVCHLDTSKWSPKNPFFELHNLKPGEVTVCHFLTKLSIIWVPVSEQGEAHASRA